MLGYTHLHCLLICFMVCVAFGKLYGIVIIHYLEIPIYIDNKIALFVEHLITILAQ